MQWYSWQQYFKIIGLEHLVKFDTIDLGKPNRRGLCEARLFDANKARWLPVRSGFYGMQLCEAFFVTRAKDNMNCRRLYSRPVEKSKGVIYDQTIKLNNYYAHKDYPEKIRCIKFIDRESGKILMFLTSNFI